MKKLFPVLEYMNVPNLITTLGLASGVAAYYLLTEGHFNGMVLCLFIASLMDLLDGFIATKMNRQTSFGQGMDSLVDFFVCCAFPVVAAFVTFDSDIFLTIAALFYCACGLWRLAYYYATSSENRKYFTGIPVPGVMLLVIAALWATLRFELPVWVLSATFAIMGLLMISCFKINKYGFCQKMLGGLWLVFIIVIMAL